MVIVFIAAEKNVKLKNVVDHYDHYDILATQIVNSFNNSVKLVFFSGFLKKYLAHKKNILGISEDFIFNKWQHCRVLRIYAAADAAAL